MDDPRGAAAVVDPPAEEERVPEPDRDDGLAREAGEALNRALDELRGIARDLVELSQVQVERARAGMRAGIFNAGIAGWLYVAGIATTVLAAWFLIDGIAGGFAALLGADWAGRAAAGILALVLIAATVAVLRASERRANLERLKRKFPEDDHERT